MKAIVVSLDAQLDLQAIWEYIAADSIDAADKWSERLYSAFELLARNAAIGHRRVDLTSAPVLFWPVESYLILYRTSPDSIEIVAVTHGGRDVPMLLSRGA